MTIINQPFQGQLGNILIEEMNKEYKSMTIFSAFAKNSGVLRMKNSMEEFKKKGGEINAFIGIDLDGTSYEALLNLFTVCDNLYVVHSENFTTTFHSKIYLLKSNDCAWCAVGSNNLTGGGLWTNFESCSIQKYKMPQDESELENIYKLIDIYTDSTYSCSRKIKSKGDIDILLESKYISKEVNQRIQKAAYQLGKREKKKKSALFGAEKINIPYMITKTKRRYPMRDREEDYNLSIEEAAPAFVNEQFWFEMRESTGGSRNILDLSKLGRIEDGTVKGTQYEYERADFMYGGIKFFDIDPEDTSCKKDIIINYRGKDYFRSTIIFNPSNGSWRIQLKGTPDDNSEELSKFGSRGEFIHKILVFEKINTEYYVLSLLKESELDKVKSLSRVWARNGTTRNSKAFGML